MSVRKLSLIGRMRRMSCDQTSLEKAEADNLNALAFNCDLEVTTIQILPIPDLFGDVLVLFTCEQSKVFHISIHAFFFIRKSSIRK